MNQPPNSPQRQNQTLGYQKPLGRPERSQVVPSEALGELQEGIMTPLWCYINPSLQVIYQT